MSNIFQLILIDSYHLANLAYPLPQTLAKLNFQAKYRQTAFLPEQNLFYVGAELANIRTTDEFYKVDFFELGASAGLAIVKLKMDHVIINQPLMNKSISSENLLNLQLGISQALWKFEKYLPKKEDEKQLIIQLAPELQAAFGSVYQTKLEALNSGIITAREIIEETPENFNPTTAPEIVKSELSSLTGVEITVWDAATMAIKGLNGVLAVGRGSSTPPNLTYCVLNRQNLVDGRRTDKVLVMDNMESAGLEASHSITGVLFDPNTQKYAVIRSRTKSGIPPFESDSFALFNKFGVNPADHQNELSETIASQTSFLDFTIQSSLGAAIVSLDIPHKNQQTGFLITLNSLAQKPIESHPSVNLIWLSSAEVLTKLTKTDPKPEQIIENGLDQTLEFFKRGVSKAIQLELDTTSDPTVFDKQFVNRVVLVGKGLTYDTGGLDIKISGGMRTMKCDMGGAATMLGVFKALAEIGKLGNTEVHWITAWVENSTDSNSYRSDDIITSLSGQTIEIRNTDAEGRVTLADTLTLATTLEPTYIVEASTLTGMSVQANGDYYTALFSNDTDLSNSLIQNFVRNGERIVDNGMPQILADKVKGDISDLINNSKLNRKAGHLTAALFLDNFVNQNKFRNPALDIKFPLHYPFAHLDVAATAYNDGQNPLKHNGATGHNIRSLVDWVLSLK